jgi:pimeloyl-ACP methyl ester carboxylesterase
MGCSQALVRVGSHNLREVHLHIMRPNTVLLFILLVCTVQGFRFPNGLTHVRHKNWRLQCDSTDDFKPDLGDADMVEAPRATADLTSTVASNLGIAPYTVVGFAMGFMIITLNTVLGQGWAADMLGWHSALMVKSSVERLAVDDVEKLGRSAVLKMDDIHARLAADRAAHSPS